MEGKPRKTQPEENINQDSAPSFDFYLMIVVLLLVILAVAFSVHYYLNSQKAPLPALPPKPTVKTEKTLTAEVLPEPAKPVPPAPKPEQSKIKSPEETIEAFYQWYLKAEGHPLDGGYKTQPAVDEELVSQINGLLIAGKPVTEDPFFCSAVKPDRFEVQPAKVSDQSGVAVVNLYFSQAAKPIKINLVLKANQWKMTRLTCLGENGPRGLLESFKLVTGLDYLTVQDTPVAWVTPDYKGRQVKTLTGKSLVTENADLTPERVRQFFEQNGFETDRYNPTGYKKDKKVCLVSVSSKKDGKSDIDIRCAEEY